MNKKKIAVFTGNRAEYGLLYPLLKKLEDHPDTELKLIVSGAHLDDNFGGTLSEIESDGFRISAEVRINLDTDSLTATANAIGNGILSMVSILAEIQPDILVVYADRFEGFSAIIAGSQMGLPVAHIEGGDVTEGGALDDSVRHAMTKLSHIHFTTNQQASNRILAMGEEPWRVHTVGFVDSDLIELGRLAAPLELAEKFNLDLEKPLVVFTQHSVALEFDEAELQLLPSLTALERIANDGVQVIVTYPNNDAGGRKIISLLKEWEKKNISENISIYPSLGQANYHGMLAMSKTGDCKVVCVGNSSSGIKETPIFGGPAVNIGSRQQGRLRADNILDVFYDDEQIYIAMRKCLFEEEYRDYCRNIESPYEHGNVGDKILDVLLDLKLDKNLLRKRMCLEGRAENSWYR